MSKISKNTEKPIQNIRFYIQLGFVLASVWIGVEFYLFMQFLQSGGAAQYYAKPPGAEGFLPISSFISFVYLLSTGAVHGSHPAGLFIFIAVIVVSFAYGKSFCSWMCPIGFLSETLGDFGEKITLKLFKKKISLPKWLDYPLRSLKYLLLAFFVYAVLVMSKDSLYYFLESPYNKMSDIKMWLFFADISKMALIIISSLFVLSVFIRNFWCRFLCPYGALLGLISFLSPNKIRRNAETCVDCGLCSKACPSSIKVDKLNTVLSDECSSCMNCVDACPVQDTLYVENIITKRRPKKKYIALGIIGIYLAIILFAVLSGNWRSKTTKEEYLKYYPVINSLGHPRSAEDMRKLNESTREALNKNNINKSKENGL